MLLAGFLDEGLLNTGFFCFHSDINSCCTSKGSSENTLGSTFPGSSQSEHWRSDRVCPSNTLSSDDELVLPFSEHSTFSPVWCTTLKWAESLHESVDLLSVVCGTFISSAELTEGTESVRVEDKSSIWISLGRHLKTCGSTFGSNRSATVTSVSSWAAVTVLQGIFWCGDSSTATTVLCFLWNTHNDEYKESFAIISFEVLWVVVLLAFNWWPLLWDEGS